MQISKLQLNLNTTAYQAKNKNEKKETTTPLSRNLGYPKGYTPYFGARLFRTPQNFYEQEFNKKGMPTTLKNYLYKDFEVNGKKPPAQLSKEAFEDLAYCENIEDVKEMFPDEPLFQNLKTLETIRPKGGYLYQLRAYGLGNKEVLQSGEDLTVYLLKKVYLESKDLDEINYDFEKDKKPELDRDKDYCNEDYYFLHSTLHSLGVMLPDKSYWKSLQSNRTDKEYTPYTFVLTKPRKKPEFTKPRVKKPLNLSPEEIQRRRNLMVNRWIDMTPAQRQAQLDKMKKGQENSVFYQYLPQIMTIATDKAHFQDKMFQFFRENKENLKTEAPLDIENPNPKQSKGMKLFWEKNPRIRKKYMYHINATIKEFEAAKEQGDEALALLLKKADKIRARNQEKIEIRFESNPALVKEQFVRYMAESAEFLPDAFSIEYIEFVKNHKRFNEEFIPLKIQQINAPNEETKKNINKKTQNIINDIYIDFYNKNQRNTISANMALGLCVSQYICGMAKRADNTGDNPTALKLLSDATSILTANTNGVIDRIYKYNLQDYIKSRKERINDIMNSFTTGLDDEELKDFCKIITNHIDDIIKTNDGNYKFLSNEAIRERGKKQMPKLYRDIENNKTVRKKMYNILKKYEGYYKYMKYFYVPDDMALSQNLNFKSIFENQKSYIIESVIDDLIIYNNKTN